VREGLRVSIVRLWDSFCSLDPRGHQVFLNAGCYKCVGHPGLALCCCRCFHVWLRGCVCVFLLRAFSLACSIF